MITGCGCTSYIIWIQSFRYWRVTSSSATIHSLPFGINSFAKPEMASPNYARSCVGLFDNWSNRHNFLRRFNAKPLLVSQSFWARRTNYGIGNYCLKPFNCHASINTKILKGSKQQWLNPQFAKPLLALQSFWARRANCEKANILLTPPQLKIEPNWGLGSKIGHSNKMPLL